MSLKPSFAATLAGTAAMFALSACAATPPKGSTGAAIAASDKVHCYGLHECKGMADCKTTENACKGQNVCKGHGFKATAAGECLSKNGVIGDIAAKK